MEQSILEILRINEAREPMRAKDLLRETVRKMVRDDISSVAHEDVLEKLEPHLRTHVSFALSFIVRQTVMEQLSRHILRHKLPPDRIPAGLAKLV